MKKALALLSMLTVAMCCCSAFGQEVPPAQAMGTLFMLDAPCRAGDTRQFNSIPLTPTYQTPYMIQLGPCGIPVAAKAILVTVTLTETTGAGFMGAWGGPGAWPGTSNLTWDRAGMTLSANFTVRVENHWWYGRFFKIVLGVSGAHLIHDVSGWYE